MCISVIYGPINQPARHRGNNSAAGKKERSLARACENRGAGGVAARGGRKSSFPRDRNFIHARAFVSRVPRPHSESTMYDSRIYWLLLLLSRERHLAPAIYEPVKQSPLISLLFFCRRNPRLFFRLINHRDIFMLVDGTVAYPNSNALDLMRSFFIITFWILDIR